jgi:sensor histidine kinase YesM
MKIKTKEITILLAATLVALFINSYRLIQLFGFVPLASPEFVQVTVPDWIMRFLSFTIFSWLILKFNLVWLDRLFEDSTTSRAKKILKSLFGIIVSVTITVLLYRTFYPLYTLIFGIEVSNIEQSGAAFGWVIVLIALLLISFILRLQLKSKNDAVEKEQLKQEKIKSELAAIKNQVNPHFLFNSLNTLNSVIRHTPENATHFVDKLSFMYRYILQSSEKDVVLLTEELAFLNSYIYLIKIRYGNRIEINININLDVDVIEVPVLSLQLLVENAVKHNEISEENPLKVEVYNDDEYIIIKNEIKTRNSLEESTGKGLLNLSTRYQILKNKDIKIYRDSNFTIKLPIA